MGAYAASGGYWISAYADHIVTAPLTVTGSIGVFGLIPNIEKLANNHGVTFDSVQTSPFSNLPYRKKEARTGNAICSKNGRCNL